MRRFEQYKKWVQSGNTKAFFQAMDQEGDDLLLMDGVTKETLSQVILSSNHAEQFLDGIFHQDTHAGLIKGLLASLDSLQALINNPAAAYFPDALNQKILTFVTEKVDGYLMAMAETLEKPTLSPVWAFLHRNLERDMLAEQVYGLFEGALEALKVAPPEPVLFNNPKAAQALNTLRTVTPRLLKMLQAFSLEPAVWESVLLSALDSDIFDRLSAFDHWVKQVNWKDFDFYDLDEKRLQFIYEQGLPLTAQDSHDMPLVVAMYHRYMLPDMLSLDDQDRLMAHVFSNDAALFKVILSDRDALIMSEKGTPQQVWMNAVIEKSKAQSTLMHMIERGYQTLPMVLWAPFNEHLSHHLSEIQMRHCRDIENQCAINKPCESCSPLSPSSEENLTSSESGASLDFGSPVLSHFRLTETEAVDGTDQKNSRVGIRPTPATPF